MVLSLPFDSESKFNGYITWPFKTLYRGERTTLKTFDYPWRYKKEHIKLDEI